jgi:hypothetical protein
VTITAKATGNLAGEPPMTGQFQISGPFPNIAPVTPVPGTDASGHATYTATLTVVPQMSGNILLNYPGDANYIGGEFFGTSLTVNIPDFSVGPAAQTLTFSAGGTGMGTITVTPTSNMASMVSLACQGSLPAGYACAFQPAMVNLANGAPANSALTVMPSANSSSSAAHARIGWGDRETIPPPGLRLFPLLGLVTGVGALAMLAFAGVRIRFRAAVGAGVVCLLCWMNACGGGGNSVSNSGPALSPSSVTLTINPSKAAQGTMVTLTAVVSGQGTPGGSVTFIGAEVPDTSLPVVNGMASLNVQFSGAGVYPVQAKYSGDAKNLPSTSSFVNELVPGAVSFQVVGNTGGLAHSVMVTATLQ